MKKTVGADFDTTFRNWVADAKADARGMRLADGTLITRSKYYGELNRQQNRIVFLSNPTGVRRPTLVSINQDDGTIKTQASSLDSGRIYQLGERYYTVSGRRTSVWRTTQGLFDQDAMIKPGSEGRVFQGRLSDGREVYFKTSESFVQPQLYVGDTYYGAVSSSVLVKEDALYYFVQKGRERVLYRNQEPVYTLKGYYGIVKDVDSEGRIYFIANTEKGSSLFRTQFGKAEQVLKADNVIDARLLGDNRVVATAISPDDYYYTIETLTPSAEQPYNVTLIWDEKGGLADQQLASIRAVKPVAFNDPEPYGLFNNLQYSAGNLSFVSVVDENEKAHTLYNFGVTFADPLNRTALTFFAMNDAEFSDLIGVGFSNNQSYLLTGVRAYYLADNQYPGDTRESGVAAQLRFPFVQTGFWSAEAAAAFYQDYRLAEREPFSLRLDVARKEQFGNSWLPNDYLGMSVFGVNDRSDLITGAAVKVSTDFPGETYASVSAKYSASDTDQAGNGRRGVELTLTDNVIDNDPSRLVISGLRGDAFARSAQLTELSASKVFNASSYGFKSGFSLRREMLMLSYRHYQLDQVNGQDHVGINQGVLGLHLDTLILNKLNIGFFAELTVSDDESLTEEHHFQAGISAPM